MRLLIIGLICLIIVHCPYITLNLILKCFFSDKISITEYIKDKTPLLFGIASHDLMNREFVSSSQKHQKNDLKSIMKAIQHNKSLVSFKQIDENFLLKKTIKKICD